jgi:hypothetical protein
MRYILVERQMVDDLKGKVLQKDRELAATVPEISGGNNEVTTHRCVLASHPAGFREFPVAGAKLGKTINRRCSPSCG